MAEEINESYEAFKFRVAISNIFGQAILCRSRDPNINEAAKWLNDCEQEIDEGLESTDKGRKKGKQCER